MARVMREVAMKPAPARRRLAPSIGEYRPPPAAAYADATAAAEPTNSSAVGIIARGLFFYEVFLNRS